MDKHTCKLCSRQFPNGRALGGHMRSHVTNNTTTKQQPPTIHHHHHAPPPSSSSSGPEEDPPINNGSYRLRENPRKSYKMVDPEFSSSEYGLLFSSGNSSSVIVQDVESDTESTREPARRRRRREAEPVSSVSDNTTPDEDVALCLMMLSRDVWYTCDKPEREDEDELEQERECGWEDETVAVRSRSRYVCTTCKKVFRSYQALGGHRASHKKMKNHEQREVEEPRVDSSRGAEINEGSAQHRCPFCSRVFSSGQALGGHKRSHFVSGGPAARAGGGGNGESFIDLNQPAPMEEASYVSAV